MVALWAVFMPGHSSLSQRGRIRARGIAWGDMCSRRRACFELWVKVSNTLTSERRGCMAEPARPRTWTNLLCRATSCDEEQFPPLFPGCFLLGGSRISLVRGDARASFRMCCPQCVCLSRICIARQALVVICFLRASFPLQEVGREGISTISHDSCTLRLE